MADLNKLAEKLKKQRNIGVTKDGRLMERDPNNNGSQNLPSQGTTLTPKRFF